MRITSEPIDGDFALRLNAREMRQLMSVCVLCTKIRSKALDVPGLPGGQLDAVAETAYRAGVALTALMQRCADQGW